MEAITEELADFLRQHQETILTNWIEALSTLPEVREIVSDSFESKYKRLISENVWPRFLLHLADPEDDYHDHLVGWAGGANLTGFDCQALTRIQFAFQQSILDHLLTHYSGSRSTLKQMVALAGREIHDHVLRIIQCHDTVNQAQGPPPSQPYGYFVENTSDMIYMVDTGGRLIFYNPVTSSLLGYDETELLGEPFASLICEPDTDEAIRRFRQAMKGEEVFSAYEMDMITRDGQPVPVELRSSTMYSEGKPVGRIGAVRNISERKQFEMDLEVQRDWFGRILHDLPDQIIVYDSDYNIIFRNQPEESWFGQKCYKSIYGFDQPCPQMGSEYPCAVQEIIHNQSSYLEYTQELPESRFRLQAAPITNPDGGRGAVEVIIDETNTRRYERVEYELQETIRQLNALQLTKSFGSSLDVQEIGHTLTNQAGKLLPLSRLLLCIHKDDAHSCHTFYPNQQGLPLSEERGMMLSTELREVFEAQEPTVWRASNLTNISLPLIYNGESIGVWTVSVAHEDYQETYRDLLSTISDHVSSAIGHSLVFLAERRQRAAKEYLHSVLQSSTDGICIMASDGEIRYLNDAIQQLLELPYTVFRDPYLFDQTIREAGPIGRRGMQRVLKHVLEHGHWEAELDVIVDSEAKQTYLLTATVIEREQDSRDVLWYAKDVTIHRQLRDQTLRSEQLAAVAELASVISHEIRNPLSAIGSAAEMLEGAESLASDDRELLQIVQAESKRVNDILNTYLQYARMNAPNSDETDIHQLLRQTVHLMETGIPTGVRVELDLSTEPALLAVDSGQFRQAFLNLIRNAFEAMPDGGVLTITSRKHPVSGQLALTFQDTGKGLEPEQIPKLFRPFYSDKENGTGMGLAIVQRVVLGHNGAIEPSNSPEGGACFTIELPM